VLASAAWPQEGCCPAHRNRSPYVATTSNAATLHGPFAIDGFPQSAPLVAADGAMFFASGGATIVALNYDGSFRWRYTDALGANAQLFAMPTLGPDGTVRAYGGYPSDVYVRLNPLDGSIAYRQTGTASMTLGAVVVGTTSYVGDNGSATVQGRDPNGALVWQGPSGGDVAVAGDGTVLSNASGTFTASSADGGTRWTNTLASDTLVGLSVTPGQSLRAFSQFSNLVYGIALDGGALEWSTVMDSGTTYEIAGLSIADDGTTYVGTGEHGLVALDATGKALRTHGGNCGPPLIDAAGNLVVWCDSKIECMSPDFLTQHWSVDVPTGPPGGSTFIPETPVVGPNGAVYFTLEISPATGTHYGAVYEVGP
jgi:hypothetical protein